MASSGERRCRSERLTNAAAGEARGRRERLQLSEGEGPRRLLRVGRELKIPMTEIALRASRSSGPGGQHANVTASRVEAIFDVLASSTLSDVQRSRVLARVGPQVAAVAQDERSQARNRELALERLAARLEGALAEPRSRRATRPSAAARARRLADKRRSAQRKLERKRPAADDE
jgi:ribosome-associated protein